MNALKSLVLEVLWVKFVLNNKMINLIMSAADSDPVSIFRDKISKLFQLPNQNFQHLMEHIKEYYLHKIFIKL
jgi:hypothetical protein